MSNILKNENNLCYLCGKEILNMEISEDHVVSKLFFEKEQPKQKGKDYFDTLKVHSGCNKIWGEKKSIMEVSCLKALKLINFISSAPKGTYANHYNIIPIEEGNLSFLDKEDLEFYGITDLRKKDYSEISSLKVFDENKPIIPNEKPINISLSVLSKNATAILIKLNLMASGDKFNILAVPIFDPNNSLKPELGLRKIGKELEYNFEIKNYGNYVVIFNYDRTIVVLGFTDFKDEAIVKDFTNLFQKNNFPIYFSEAVSLNDLIDYNWTQNPFILKR